MHIRNLSSLLAKYFFVIYQGLFFYHDLFYHLIVDCIKHTEHIGRRPLLVQGAVFLFLPLLILSVISCVINNPLLFVLFRIIF